ncbi:MAG: bacillithiol biosynthesis cysteine-adding enzyme BshC [Bacteroidia bacterium]
MEIRKSAVSLDEINGFSTILKAYLSGQPDLAGLYNYTPDLQGFEKAIAEAPYTKMDRETLVSVFQKQYKESGIIINEKIAAHLDLLKQQNTFTICTGHQLCLFTGPLYFIYKIVTAINLAETLQKKFPASNFVPVYWMASEDHDFEEINHVRLFGKNHVWDPAPLQTGSIPCGSIPSDSLSGLIETVKDILGTSTHAETLVKMLENAYLKQPDLAKATRTLVHTLFEQYGILTLDGSDKELKKVFKPLMKEELLNQVSYAPVMKGIEALEKLGYKAQVNPRPVNLFYMKTDLRSRIEKTEGMDDYTLVNTEIKFSTKALLEELEMYPERFSPNVVLRPVYQQLILPNLAYVGGPGELAYWLEYKGLFEAWKVFFPVLVPRNFVMWVEENVSAKMQKLGQTVSSLSQPLPDLERTFVQDHSGQSLSLEAETTALKTVYEGIVAAAANADATLKAPAEAELQKALNGIKNLEAKMMKAEKQRQETGLAQLRNIREKLYPEASLQERVENFMPLYLRHGERFIETLKNGLDPFEHKMVVFTEKDDSKLK